MIPFVRRGEPPVEPNTLPPSPRIWKPEMSLRLMIRAVTSEQGREAASSATCANETRDQKEQNDPAYHDHVGCGPERCDPPSAAPLRLGQPTVLQHQRLHQLSHCRLDEWCRPLRHLRLHPPPSLRDRPTVRRASHLALTAPRPCAPWPERLISSAPRRWRFHLGGSVAPDGMNRRPPLS
jgi:hypothetical protein